MRRVQIFSMGADAQGACARQFKNRDNPSSRSTLRSRAPHPQPPSSSSPHPNCHHSSNTGRRRAIFTAGDSPSLIITFSSPSHHHPFSLSLTPLFLLPAELPPRHRLRLRAAITAFPSLSSLLSYSSDLLALSPSPSLPPQFLEPPRHRSWRCQSVSAALALSMSDKDDREITIPWGVWVHEKPPASRRSRARTVIGTPSPPAPAAGPSSSTAAAPSPSTDPPAAPEPTYLLVQRLFRFLERERHHVRRRLDRMDQALISLGAELPPLPDSPASDEQDHQEEDAEAPAQQDAPDTTEPAHMAAPPQTQETQPVPQPQSEPEPIVVPPTDPPV
ncbi:phosphatase and actin regulator 4A-like [Arachis ipaensis]|uniref:phosphatase and actin regulator 4A-like n=1 Tax=Arachis ipaensis TaxID=130454 RepID=UPI0007AF8575|nr:phosphatase and actin regulator 4A-like [Arachis ipaensis]